MPLSIGECLAAPVVRFASEDIQLATHSRRLSRSAISSLEASLRRRLSWIAGPVILWELGVPNQESARQQKSSRQIEKLYPAGTAAKALYLFGKYPVLARLWTVQVEWWQQFVVDLLKHSAAFSKAIKVSAKARDRIEAIKTDLSDPHDGGRTVLRVRFGNASEWYYKPRTGRQEVVWFNLLQWLNQEDFPIPFRTLKVK